MADRETHRGPPPSRKHLPLDEVLRLRRAARFEKIDDLPKEVRACVYEYGWTIVTACLDLGIVQARQIRHLVETVLDEFSPTRGSSSTQGVKRALGLSQQPAQDGGATDA